MSTYLVRPPSCIHGLSRRLSPAWCASLALLAATGAFAKPAPSPATRREEAVRLEAAAEKATPARAYEALMHAGLRFTELHQRSREAADLEAALRVYVRASALAPRAKVSAPLLRRARLLLEHRADKSEAHAALTEIVKDHGRGADARTARRLLKLLRAFEPARAASRVVSIREERGPASTRIVVELDGALKRIPTPIAAAPLDKVRIPLPVKDLPKALREKRPGRGVVRYTSLRRFQDGALFEVAVREPVRTRVFYLRSPHRVVIDVATLGPAERAEAARASPAAPVDLGPSTAALGSLVRRVVIDPGHGGKDPGALGRRSKLREKDVTLAISKRLAALLRRTGVEVTLTREDDDTLSLSQRTQLANEKGADLFVSVHVNSNPDQKRHGLETYYLDTTRDAYARRLAERENQAGGEVKSLDFILADLHQKSNVQSSMRLAGQVLRASVQHLSGRYAEIVGHGVKPAMFYVLLGAKMPSILVETSYLTNARDEKRMRDGAYLQRIAEGIFLGIRRFALGARVALATDR